MHRFFFRCALLVELGVHACSGTDAAFAQGLKSGAGRNGAVARGAVVRIRVT